MRMRVHTIVGCAGVLGAVIMTASLMQPLPGLYQLDVGQGDAALLIGDRGARILIDTGDGRLIEQRLDAILPPWDRHLDLVVVTHTDADHAGGLAPLFSRGSLRNVVWTGVPSARTEIREVLTTLSNDGRALLVPSEIRRIDIDGWYLEFLAPRQDLRDLVTTQTNATSIVTVGSYGGMWFVSSGDATVMEEHAILHAIENTAPGEYGMNVMKLGHHGSLTSTAPAWLSQWNPACIVISSGQKNPYGHPHPMILTRLLVAISRDHIQRTDEGKSFWYHVEDGFVVAESLSLSHHRVFDRIKSTISSILSLWRPSYGNRTNTDHPQTRCGPAQARRTHPARI